tara:strand:- start:146 stop:340 length:195 start_codon:yes stop_codon:yes gene_type:complete
VLLIFYCSATIGSEKTQTKESISFYEKEPAIQRQIFIDEVKKLISSIKKALKNLQLNFKNYYLR